MKQSLCMPNCEIVKASPNRLNVYLGIKQRLPNNYGIKSYDDILRPIASELITKRDEYPLTIIYMGIRYCGMLINCLRC